MRKTIKLNTFDDIKSFVNLTTQMKCDVLLISGRYAVDAKSIMGIMSLSLSKPVIVELIERDYQEKDIFLHKLYELGILAE